MGLFLNWNKADNEFWIDSLQYGAFLISDERIDPFAQSRLGDAWRGKDVNDLAAAIAHHPSGRR